MHYQPMLSAIQNGLQGWTSNSLSYGGRITMVNAVLSAMPLNYMQALKIPLGIIKHIDKMRWSFLWKGGGTCKGINCLINWKTICGLKSNGGLGVIDLTCQNDALLLKWIWRLENNQDGIWASTITRLYGVSEATHIEHASDSSPSLKSLSSLLPFYRCSVENVNGLRVMHQRWVH